jgi:hypothetical protein
MYQRISRARGFCDLEVSGFLRIFATDMNMIKLDEKKLAKLTTSSQHFDEKYGPVGSPSRDEFEAKAKAWYGAEI